MPASAGIGSPPLHRLCGVPTASRHGARRAHRLPARLAPEPDNGRVAVGHLDKPQTFAAAGVAVRDDLHDVHQARGLTKLAELLGCGGTRQMGSRDMHVRFLGERRHTIARSSTQYAATIPRRRSSASQHEDQRRGPMIPSDARILPEKIAWRYVFRGRSRVTSPIVGERVAYVIISFVSIARTSP